MSASGGDDSGRRSKDKEAVESDSARKARKAREWLDENAIRAAEERQKQKRESWARLCQPRKYGVTTGGLSVDPPKFVRERAGVGLYCHSNTNTNPNRRTEKHILAKPEEVYGKVPHRLVQDQGDVKVPPRQPRYQLEGVQEGLNMKAAIKQSSRREEVKVSPQYFAHPLPARPPLSTRSEQGQRNGKHFNCAPEDFCDSFRSGRKVKDTVQKLKKQDASDDSPNRYLAVSSKSTKASPRAQPKSLVHPDPKPILFDAPRNRDLDQVGEKSGVLFSRRDRNVHVREPKTDIHHPLNSERAIDKNRSNFRRPCSAWNSQISPNPECTKHVPKSLQLSSLDIPGDRDQIRLQDQTDSILHQDMTLNVAETLKPLNDGRVGRIQLGDGLLVLDTDGADKVDHIPDTRTGQADDKRRDSDEVLC